MTNEKLIITREDILGIDLGSFILISIHKENEDKERKARRIELVGSKSPLRRFLIRKLDSRKKKFKKNLSRQELKEISNDDLERKIASQMWHDMKTDTIFFKGFSFPEIKASSENDAHDDRKNLSEKRLREFSIRDIFKFSLTPDEITTLFKIEPWRFVTFHIFRECYPEKSLSFEKLSEEMPHFDSRLVDVIMKSKSAKTLSRKQQQIISEVLKGESPEESLADFRTVFLELLEEALRPETLDEITLGNTFLSRLISKMSYQNVSPEVLAKRNPDSVSIIITLLKNQERLDGQFVLKECPLWRRCEKVAEIFSRGKKAHHLSCLKCPQVIHAKSRFREELLTRDQSNLHNDY